MDGSIRTCIREKNRWSGKAMFTESHESGQEDVLMVSGLTPSRASPLPQGFTASTAFVHDPDHCGSGLAREGGNPVSEPYPRASSIMQLVDLVAYNHPPKQYRYD